MIVLFINVFQFSRRQWDGLIKHWKIRIHEWDQETNNPDQETNTSELTTTNKRSNDGKKIEDDSNIAIEPKNYNSHWLSSQEHRILDWSEECELEDQSKLTKEENKDDDDDVETKRRKTFF